MSDATQLKIALKAAPIVPVLTVPDADQAAPLALAFEKAGVTVIEVTLRTDASLDVIKQMKAAAPHLQVGAGTILSPDKMASALNAGSDFLVSPGLPPNLIDAASRSPVPFLPGVATPTEAMTLSDAGFDMLKLFPTGVVGGLAMLKSLAGPLPHISFMPTGGVKLDNLADYLACPNVVAGGGTWLAPVDDIRTENWGLIIERTRQALAAIH